MLKSCLTVAALLLLGTSAFSQTAEPTTQPLDDASCIRQQVAAIDARLGSRVNPLSDADRTRLAQEKAELKSRLAELRIAPEETQDKPRRLLSPGVASFIDLCREEKRRVIKDVDRQIEQQKEKFRTADKLDKRDAQKGIYDLQNLRTYFCNNNVIVAPFIVDKTQTRRTLGVGMIGKTAGLNIVKIVSPQSAIVHVFVPGANKKEVVVSTTYVLGNSTTTTGSAYTIREAKIDELAQDLYMTGLDTSAMYNGQIYDGDLVLEIDAIEQVDGRAMPKASRFDLSQCLR